MFNKEATPAKMEPLLFSVRLEGGNLLGGDRRANSSLGDALDERRWDFHQRTVTTSLDYDAVEDVLALIAEERLRRSYGGARSVGNRRLVGRRSPGDLIVGQRGSPTPKVGVRRAR
jgi:hypothetical protein